MSDVPARTFVELCQRNATAAPNSEAVVDDRGGRLTYSHLYRHGMSLARGLRSAGVRPGQTVALLAPNRAEWVVSALGAQAAGAQVAAFHTWVKAHDLNYLLAHSEAETLVVASGVGGQSLLEPLRSLIPELWEHGESQWSSSRYPRLRRVVVIGDGAPAGAFAWEAMLDQGNAVEFELQVNVDAKDVAFVLYTSGSTAEPKGVPLLHGDMVANGFHIGERMGLTPADRVWLGSPLFWSFGSANAMTAAFGHGAALIVQEKFDAEAATLQIAKERCTAAYLLPALAHSFTKVSDVRRAFSTVRTGLTIGRPDEVEMIAATLGVEEICNVYGSTETYGNCCVTPHDMALSDRIKCQGPPLPGVTVRIVDPSSGQVLPTGSDGAVEVRGRITPGYWKSPELNAETFTKDGWYRSGDIGRLAPDGCFTFVTRHSDMIKTSGINVSPAEVEAFLLTHPEVAEVVVVGAPDPERDEVVVAFVRPEDGSRLDADELIAFCRRTLASYKVPRQVRIVDAMPHTATGKLSRKQLRQTLAAGDDPLADGSFPAGSPELRP